MKGDRYYFSRIRWDDRRGVFTTEDGVVVQMNSDWRVLCEEPAANECMRRRKKRSKRAYPKAHSRSLCSKTFVRR